MGEKVDAIIQVKRGEEADRLSVKFREGELAYSTDIQRLYIGDGETYGGRAASSKLYYGDPVQLGNTIMGLVCGDYFLDTTAEYSPKLYALTSADFSRLSSYTIVCDNGPAVIAYNVVKSNSAYWGEAGGITFLAAETILKTYSGAWIDTYTTVYYNSANWDAAATAALDSIVMNSIVSQNSAKWNETSTIVNENSAKWLTQEGIREESYFTPESITTNNQFLQIKIGDTIKYIRLWDGIPS